MLAVRPPDCANAEPAPGANCYESPPDEPMVTKSERPEPQPKRCKRTSEHGYEPEEPETVPQSVFTDVVAPAAVITPGSPLGESACYSTASGRGPIDASPKVVSVGVVSGLVQTHAISQGSLEDQVAATTLAAPQVVSPAAGSSPAEGGSKVVKTMVVGSLCQTPAQLQDGLGGQVSAPTLASSQVVPIGTSASPEVNACAPLQGRAAYGARALAACMGSRELTNKKARTSYQTHLAKHAKALRTGRPLRPCPSVQRVAPPKPHSEERVANTFPEDSASNFVNPCSVSNLRASASHVTDKL